VTLPVKVVDINTAAWSDHRNQNHGGVPQVLVSSDTDDNGAFFSLGHMHEYAGYREGGISGGEGHKILRISLFLQRVGSPSGSVRLEIYDSTSSTLPDFSLLLATSLSYPASSIPTAAKTEVVFSFPIPTTQPAVGSNTIRFPVARISVQGDSSNYIKVFKRSESGRNGGSRPYGSSTWTNESDVELSNVYVVAQSGAFVFAVDKTNNKARAYKTTDNGMTWAEQGAASAPGILTTSAMKSINAQGLIQDLDTSYVGMFPGSTNAGFYKITSSVWSFIAQKSFGAVNTNVSTTGPIGGGRRANGNLIVIVQGATETVMGNARRRIKLAFWNGTTFSSEFDVAGSANTPDATLPGTAVDYDLRWSIVDPGGDCHIVYSKSDTSTLQYRKFKADNTFTTINTLNGAVASASANYPVGQGAIYYQAPDFYLAIPYVDNTSNTLKLARCKTTITETSANWTLTEIVAASAEVSGSNPAVLMADNGQGGKLFCWRVVPTTKALRFTNDAASNTWAAETDWKGGGQVVGGISGFYIEDGIALVYLEEGTTPDELRYDRL
jgi:hypothetical protein